MTPSVVLAATRSVPGGAQRAMAMLAPALRTLGWTPSAALAERGWLAEALDRLDIDVAVGPRPRLDDADVVVSLGASGHAWAGPEAARLDMPACWWVELGYRARPVEQAALALGAHTIAVPTDSAAERLAPHVGGGAQIEIIPPGVDPGPIDGHRRAGRKIRSEVAPPSATVLVMVARIDPIKGQDVAIDALARLRAAGRDVRLALVGGTIVGHEGDLEQRLRNRVADRGLTDAVTFVGQVDDPGPWHAAADVAIHAALHEAFGLAVVEAVAHGIPVVASDTDGPRAILSRGDAGVLVGPGDPAALADAVASVLDDPERAAHLRAAGPARAAAFTPQVAAQRWDAVLRAAMRGGCAAVDSPAVPGGQAPIA